jgi:hypothetical protein
LTKRALIHQEFAQIIFQVSLEFIALLGVDVDFPHPLFIQAFQVGRAERLIRVGVQHVAAMQFDINPTLPFSAGKYHQRRDREKKAVLRAALVICAYHLTAPVFRMV